MITLKVVLKCDVATTSDVESCVELLKVIPAFIIYIDYGCQM